jgi:hypothetical protein
MQYPSLRQYTIPSRALKHGCIQAPHSWMSCNWAIICESLISPSILTSFRTPAGTGLKRHSKSGPSLSHACCRILHERAHSANQRPVFGGRVHNTHVQLSCPLSLKGHAQPIVLLRDRESGAPDVLKRTQAALLDAVLSWLSLQGVRCAVCLHGCLVLIGIGELRWILIGKRDLAVVGTVMDRACKSL